MNRRTLLATAIPFVALPTLAQAFSFIQYTPARWDELKKSDQTVILNFRASWSLTCNQKLEMIVQLIAENPEYQNLSFVDIDWDTYGQSVLASRLKVTRNSTLVIMKQGKEVSRIVNQPYERKIRTFLDTALAA